MDSTTRSVIDSITTRHGAPRVIPGGHLCSVIYETALLSPNDLARLAADATGHLDHELFDIAVGVAFSGILFAAAVAGGRQVGILTEEGTVVGPPVLGKKVLIVDDVVFSGGRLARAGKFVAASGGVIAGYACIVDRSDGRFSTVQPPLELPLWSAFQTDLL